MTSIFSDDGRCAGFLLKTARGWRAFAVHAGCASRVRLATESEIGFYQTAALAREAVLAPLVEERTSE